MTLLVTNPESRTTARNNGSWQTLPLGAMRLKTWKPSYFILVLSMNPRPPRIAPRAATMMNAPIGFTS